ncbi:glycosyl transferase family protein [Aliishimia ponticola]|uniref:Glycosyl transferase family protein n=1 Tax=Aliishimia ponticola TaxID=2499833 RepID=A0A4V3XL23_9RHOB|nr:glycosyl transferase family protein [Aliishimia ponticola]THH39133.1 glycosyl transferase family protein [Aliishimia ponticola]
MSLAAHVRTLGRGPSRSRSLTEDEARDAMAAMLREDAAPEAVGALLMLLRMKGETAEEIAGFAASARAHLPQLPAVDLDWPSYAAGRTRGAPWFLLSAKMVAQAGHRVLLHGWNGIDPKVRAGLKAAGIPVVVTPEALADALDQGGIAYLPLEDTHKALFRLLNLRDVLGLRSCINTVCRMLNPAGATASVQGVFHPSYRLLQADAARVLGWQSLSVIKGGGGEFERTPAKDVAAFGLRGGQAWEQVFAASLPEPRRLSDTDAESFAAFARSGGAALGAFETAIVTGTAALALDTLGAANGTATAKDLWSRQINQTAA